MTVHELISLVGVKSTDPKLVQFFETLGIEKPPKFINANQREKYSTDKQNKLSFRFGYDIAHDRFYPPVSPKNNYNFECYLLAIAIFSGTGKKKTPDPKPAAFWEGFINPQSTYAECLAFLPNAKENDNFNITISIPLNDVVEIIIFFSDDRSRIIEMKLGIIEAREMFSYKDFDPKNTHNTVKQAETLPVKWLFDNRYLLLPDEAYRETLGFDQAAILAFTVKYLKNHIWDTQIVDDGFLDHFLYTVRKNSVITTTEGEEINVYIKNLCIKAAGKWEEYQKIYNNKDIEHWGETVHDFESSIQLNEAHSKTFLQSLTDLYEIYKKIPRKKWNEH